MHAVVIDHFSGPGRALGPMCVCVYGQKQLSADLSTIAPDQ